MQTWKVPTAFLSTLDAVRDDKIGDVCHRLRTLVCRRLKNIYGTDVAFRIRGWNLG